RGHRTHRPIPGRRRGRLHHRLDAFRQWRPAHVLTRRSWATGVRISRRGLLALLMQLMTPRLVEAAETGHESLEYRAGPLRWPGGSAPAAVGRGGVRANKKEGDEATPAGIYPLIFGFYREDRIKPPPSRLPMRVLAPHDAWVDDPTDARYNSL